MIPSVEQLERWSVHRADGLTTIPSSAWDGVMWFLRCLELMESDPDAQEAFKRAADQLRDTKETQKVRGQWITRNDGTFGPPRHWYAMRTEVCVLCGRESTTRERVYQRSKATRKRVETACQSHFL